MKTPPSSTILAGARVNNPRSLLLLLLALPLGAAEIRIPVDRQSRPVAEAVARSNAMPHRGQERIEATVTLGRRDYPIQASNKGFFPELDMGPTMRARVELHFPEAKPGDKVVIGAMDGGRIMLQDADRRISPAKETTHVIGADRKVRIIFESGSGDGIFRVMVRRGMEARFLPFWVGPKPEMSKRPAPGKEAVTLNR